jgi:hypothetical protein
MKGEAESRSQNLEFRSQNTELARGTPTRRHADTPTRRHADTPTRRHAEQRRYRRERIEKLTTGPLSGFLLPNKTS